MQQFQACAGAAVKDVSTENKKNQELQLKISLATMQRKKNNIIDIITKIVINSISFFNFFLQLNDEYCVIYPEEWSIISSENLNIYESDIEKYQLLSKKYDNILGFENSPSTVEILEKVISLNKFYYVFRQTIF